MEEMKFIFLFITEKMTQSAKQNRLSCPPILKELRKERLSMQRIIIYIIALFITSFPELFSIVGTDKEVDIMCLAERKHGRCHLLNKINGLSFSKCVYDEKNNT